MHEATEATDACARWKCDPGCVVDVIHLAVPGRLMYWDDLAGELVDPDEVQKARRLET